MKKVAVLQSQALVSMDHPERGITAGGTQRYALQLAKLLHREGYTVYIIARSKVICDDFDIDVAHINVYATPLNKKGNYLYSKYVFDFCKNINATFVCYIDMGVAKHFCYPNSISLQHGIGWDGPVKIHQRVKRFFETREYVRIAKKFKKIICVDTNFINWARCSDSNFFKNQGRYVYVPNFADEELFTYEYKQWDNDQEKILLYPRRLVEYRGYSLFIEMCEILKEKGYNIKPVLAFEKNDADDYTKLFEEKKCEYTIVNPSMFEMEKEYKRAFLTYVPTIWSEGTSLSAIEAISSGCPVITSDVGGLGNIVIPNLVGEILSPTVEEFVSATEKVLKDSCIRNNWAKNCEIVRKSYLTSSWDEKVLRIIRETTSSTKGTQNEE